MGRQEKKITDSGPLGKLARELRRIRIAHGEPTYREMGQRVHRAPTSLSTAAAGNPAEGLPALVIVQAYMTALEAAPEELAKVERLWHRAREALAHRALDDEAYAPTSTARRRWVRPASVSAETMHPVEISAVNSARDLRAELGALRTSVGKPPYREIVNAVQWLQVRDLIPRSFSPTTVTRAFTGDGRLPTWPVVEAVVEALFTLAGVTCGQRDRARWQLVWARACEGEQWRRAPRTVALVIAEPPPKPIGVIVRLGADDAAALLRHLSEAEQTEVIRELVGADPAMAAELFRALRTDPPPEFTLGPLPLAEHTSI